jgi:hypothetical protein
MGRTEAVSAQEKVKTALNGIKKGMCMKNMIWIMALVSMFLFPGALFAQEDPHKALFTDRMLNGRFLTGLSDETASVFVQGIIDGIGKAVPGTLGKIYPGSSREDVVMAVKKYYVDNPDKLDRPVADVVMGGCK